MQKEITRGSTGSQDEDLRPLEDVVVGARVTTHDPDLRRRVDGGLGVGSRQDETHVAGPVVGQGAYQGAGTLPVADDDQGGAAEAGEGTAGLVGVVGQEVELIIEAHLRCAVEDDVLARVDQSQVAVLAKRADEDLEPFPSLLPESLPQLGLRVLPLQKGIDGTKRSVGVIPADLKT